ncbi:MAG: NUDIX domain-containing protein, partial [Clostridia bacterium]|nr:NUDIX domain-containing protein [Clostridia bacterium]
EEKACGCIISENNKILLIRQISGMWGFPKGHVEEGETEEQTAIREVKEETNIDVQVDSSKRYVMHYKTDKGKYKEVVFFIGKKIGGYLRMQPEEIIEAGWFDYEDALKIISYDNTRDLFKQVIKENALV